MGKNGARLVNNEQFKLQSFISGPTFHRNKVIRILRKSNMSLKTDKKM